MIGKYKIKQMVIDEFVRHGMKYDDEIIEDFYDKMIMEYLWTGSRIKDVIGSLLLSAGEDGKQKNDS